MNSIPHHSSFSIETEYCSTLTKNEQLSVVTQDSKAVKAFVVGDEGIVIWEHDVCDARVSASIIIFGDVSENASFRRVQFGSSTQANGRCNG